jgi:hypothetical protein
MNLISWSLLFTVTFSFLYYNVGDKQRMIEDSFHVCEGNANLEFSLVITVTVISETGKCIYCLFDV